MRNACRLEVEEVMETRETTYAQTLMSFLTSDAKVSRVECDGKKTQAIYVGLREAKMANSLFRYVEVKLVDGCVKLIRSNASKYHPLLDYLEKETADKIEMSFAGIESVLGFGLPRSARKHEPWWGNDEKHAQAKAWLRAERKTTGLSMTDERVTFVRVGDR